MKIKIKGLSAEIELELPNEGDMMKYHDKALQVIIDKCSDRIVDIETKLYELRNEK